MNLSEKYKELETEYNKWGDDRPMKNYVAIDEEGSIYYFQSVFPLDVLNPYASYVFDDYPSMTVLELAEQHTERCKQWYQFDVDMLDAIETEIEETSEPE